jgi:hypothetical protein
MRREVDELTPRVIDDFQRKAPGLIGLEPGRR